MDKQQLVQQLLKSHIQPVVRKIDEEAYYARAYLLALGKAGLWNRDPQQEMMVVKETARVCMTTAFCVWCHLAAITYLRLTANQALKPRLAQLESGELLGATGLSNPMKHYAGLEKLHLVASKVEGGYKVNGVLPAVSNLADNHWFGAIATAGQQHKMFMVNTNNSQLTLKEKANFIGVNGSATYTCKFDNVFIAERDIIAEDAASFIETVRPTFILYQLPLAYGVAQEAIAEIQKVKGKQHGSNGYLRVQADALATTLQQLETTAYPMSITALYNLRLQAAYLALQATQTAMLHQGSAAYVIGGKVQRKLREAYFFANLTPTIRQLEKVLAS